VGEKRGEEKRREDRRGEERRGEERRGGEEGQLFDVVVRSVGEEGHE
jgi:hypothetical protein